MAWIVGPAATFPRSTLNEVVTIGLVNNSPVRSQKATTEQFLNVLRAAAPATDFRLLLFTCREPEQNDEAEQSRDGYCSDFESLFRTQLDALIVTGMEPQAAELRDEPVFEKLARLVDWAEYNAVPTIWSCLAAHVAVFHLDGVSRYRLPDKLSGVFDCYCAQPDHRLMAGLPATWASPHSRQYGVSEQFLAARGYRVLSWSEEAGVDIFAKDGAAPFVFFQGHPEYQQDQLLREFKRDLRRFLIGERDDCPITPLHYFDQRVASLLGELRHDAQETGRYPLSLEQVGRMLDTAVTAPAWASSSTVIYQNWFNSVQAQRHAVRHKQMRGGGARRSGRDYGARVHHERPEVAASYRSTGGEVPGH